MELAVRAIRRRETGPFVLPGHVVGDERRGLSGDHEDRPGGGSGGDRARSVPHHRSFYGRRYQRVRSSSHSSPSSRPSRLTRITPHHRLAFIDIVEHLRRTFGDASSSPHPWCSDHNLTYTIRHITFAEFAASSSSYNAHLNAYYSKYQIPAWDFVHPHDFTSRLHLPFFRSWRGHRYVLPKASVQPFEREYAAGRHDMPGYMKSMEWIRSNPLTMRSLYTYG